MSDLTLEQVKKAGRFAWETSYTNGLSVFVPGIGFAWIQHDADDADPETGIVNTGADMLHPPIDEPDGWHHLPSCDCEFCRP